MLRLKLRVASAAAAAIGARKIVQLNESNPVLTNNAVNRGFKSNVWVESADDYWWKSLTKVREGERPTECQVPTLIELYNVDQLASRPSEIDDQKHGHFSVKTKKRYSGRFAAALTTFAEENKFDSKWWLSPAEVRKRGIRVNSGERPFGMQSQRVAQFFNADQFDNPQAISTRAFNGGSGRAYDERIGEFLRSHAASLGLDTVVYFTPRQLEALKVNMPVGISPAEVPFEGSYVVKLYPVEDIVDGPAFLNSLNRFAVSEPTYVISGRPLPDNLKAEAKKMNIKSNYWISEAELRTRQQKLKDGPTHAISPPQDKVSTWQAYHLLQFSDEDQKVLATKIGVA